MKKLILFLVIVLISVTGRTQTTNSENGYITGGVTFASESFPDQMVVEAVNRNTGNRYNTNKFFEEHDQRHYKLAVPPGEYFIYVIFGKFENKYDKVYCTTYEKPKTYYEKRIITVKSKQIVNGVEIEDFGIFNKDFDLREHDQPDYKPDVNVNSNLKSSSSPTTINTSALNYTRGDLYYDKEATILMYQEINKYRVKNGLKELEPLERLMNYSQRWCNYLMEQYIDSSKASAKRMLFYHSKGGPQEFRPPIGVGENIGMIAYVSKLTPKEIVIQQMYGEIRGVSTNCFTKSKGHNDNLIHPDILYVGCAVYVMYEEKEDLWIIFVCQNFDAYVERK